MDKWHWGEIMENALRSFTELDLTHTFRTIWDTLPPQKRNPKKKNWMSLILLFWVHLHRYFSEFLTKEHVAKTQLTEVLPGMLAFAFK